MASKKRCADKLVNSSSRDQTRSVLRFFSVCLLLLAVSCEPGGKERPYGYLRLGKVADLADPFTVLVKDKLILRLDERGFSAMSTLCTHDLSPLKLLRSDEGVLYLESDYSTSKYSVVGKVLEGPTTHDLPYYRLQIASSSYGGPNDTLYAEIGKVVSNQWRLSYPRPNEPKVASPEDSELSQTYPAPQEQ